MQNELDKPRWERAIWIVQRCKWLVAQPAFDTAMVGVILINAVILGAETYGELSDQHDRLFDDLDNVILGVYTVELLIRFTACRWNPRLFTRDNWNIFDFVVVTVSFVPALRQYLMVLRLVRVLRIVRIVRFLPELRVVLNAIARSLPGVASLVAATVLLIYIYGMIGWAVFGHQDPEQFGDVGRGMMTMFVMLTYANLEDVMDKGMQISNWTALFFISYVLIVGFLLFNLFVGVVLNAMHEARSAERAERDDELLVRLHAAKGALEAVERELQKRSGPGGPSNSSAPMYFVNDVDRLGISSAKKEGS